MSLNEQIAEINTQLAALKKQKEELKARKRMLLFPTVLDHWLDDELGKYKASFLEHVKVAPLIKETAGYGKHGSSTKTVDISYTWDEQVVTACYNYWGYSDEIVFELDGRSICSNKVYELEELDEMPEAHRLAIILLKAAWEGEDGSIYNYLGQRVSNDEDGDEE